MCTLTFRLTDSGYQLFFNRDEQHSRPIAIAPHYKPQLKSIYPIDPSGHGTWLSVDHHGMSLALLNNYPLQPNEPPHFDAGQIFLSRGEIILSLLEKQASENERLTQHTIYLHFNELKLINYRPFKLIIFPSNLTFTNGNIHSLNWDGVNIEVQDIGYKNLPITSSSINFKKTCYARERSYQLMCKDQSPSSSQLKAYHLSTEKEASMSVNMIRKDARTVSISHISVASEIIFEYIDNLNNCHSLQSLKRIN